MTTVSFFHLYIFYILQHNKQVDTTYLIPSFVKSDEHERALPSDQIVHPTFSYLRVRR